MQNAKTDNSSDVPYDAIQSSPAAAVTSVAIQETSKVGTTKNFPPSATQSCNNEVSDQILNFAILLFKRLNEIMLCITSICALFVKAE